MIVTCVQFEPTHRHVAANLDSIDRLTPDDADLVVFPELATCGYLFLDPTDLRRVAFSRKSPEMERLHGVAERCNCHLVVGFAEATAEGVYNSAALIGPAGLVDVYRKVHLFNTEKRVFVPGNEAWRVNKIGDATVGMMICFDWQFPEVARILALKGADLICHPSNLVLPYCQTAMVTRCLENRVFAATCNRVGTETVGGEQVNFTGQSQILTPLGERLAQASVDTPDVIRATLDPSQARHKNINELNDWHADRRPELYGDLTRDDRS